MNEYDFVASRFLATVKRPCQNWYRMKIYLQTLSVKAQARTCPIPRPPDGLPPRPNKRARMSVARRRRWRRRRGGGGQQGVRKPECEMIRVALYPRTRYSHIPRLLLLLLLLPLDAGVLGTVFQVGVVFAVQFMRVAFNLSKI